MQALKGILAGLALSMAGLVLADEAQRHPDVVEVEVVPAGETRTVTLPGRQGDGD
ncbi:MAG: hypothetical protein IBX53_07660 [Halomonas sp.]|uniref:hypothetical protein n=1 Tax=Halomonas sp. TaxID=1486246 RepID=UPI0019FA799C|nr:hypothetical protein [Halomonas sp.]MBE0488942.1 hypothetical protein [Halomonas sp.]